MAVKESTQKEHATDIWIFFILTYVISWIFWAPIILESLGFLPASPITDFFMSPFNPAAFGPLLAALIMSYRAGKLQAIKDLLKSGINIKFSKIWLLPVLFLFPIIVVVSAVIGMIAVDFTFPALTAELVFVVPISFIIILLTAGPLQEEFGWRGYALPRLQERFSALTSSIILGLLWSAWHLPLFLVYAGATGSMYYQHPIWVMFIAVTFSTIIFTWVYNNANGSVLATLLLHTSLNLSLWLFPILNTQVATYASLVLFVIVAVVLVVVYGQKMLRKEK
ncbi:MAG: CPBP family intramembrane glutamic endopeptidase [Candidatus Thorarchaeota archaeon]